MVCTTVCDVPTSVIIADRGSHTDGCVCDEIRGPYIIKLRVLLETPHPCVIRMSEVKGLSFCPCLSRSLNGFQCIDHVSSSRTLVRQTEVSDT